MQKDLLDLVSDLPGKPGVRMRVIYDTTDPAAKTVRFELSAAGTIAPWSVACTSDWRPGADPIEGTHEIASELHISLSSPKTAILSRLFINYMCICNNAKRNKEHVTCIYFLYTNNFVAYGRYGAGDLSSPLDRFAETYSHSFPLKANVIINSKKRTFNSGRTDLDRKFLEKSRIHFVDLFYDGPGYDFAILDQDAADAVDKYL